MHLLVPELPSPLKEISDERLTKRNVRLYLKRDDLIHPDIPGNKWRKLAYNLEEAKSQGHKTLLTFGGAYSNHIAAVAAAGRHFDFSTIGVVRGEEHLPLNPVLNKARSVGMRLTYMDRTSYRKKTDPAVVEQLREQFGDFYLLPEGGSNALAVKGCSEIPAEITVPYDVICCATATGGTLAGIAAGMQPHKQAIGFAALKGASFLYSDIQALQHAYGVKTSNWSLELEYHCGGFARRTPTLDHFIGAFRQRHSISLDRVYVGKMMHGVFDLIRQGRFPSGTTIIAVVTG